MSVIRILYTIIGPSDDAARQSLSIMQITYSCHQCDATCVADDVTESTTQLTCASCRQEIELPREGFVEGFLHRCLVCPCRELFVRKDFNQRLGVTVIVLGFLLSTVAWAYRRPLWTFAILFATAAVDMVLYFTVKNLVQCYRCQAEYRGLEELERYGQFSLETHERFRQEAARLATAQAAAAGEKISSSPAPAEELSDQSEPAS